MKVVITNTATTTTTAAAAATTIIASFRRYAINSTYTAVTEGITNYVNNHYWRPTHFHTVTMWQTCQRM